MSDPFDPYYIWLGIPPDDQPPNHYRLLGIELFEASGEVIEAAANRQMAYMQEISAGDEHIDEAQKILGELSRARVCLLSADKKKAYDAELQASFDSLDQASEEQDPDQGTQTPAVASPRDRDKSFLPAQTEDDEGDTAPILGTDAPRVGPVKKHRTSTRPTTRSTTRKKKKKQDATVPILVGLGAAMLFIVFLVVVLNSSGSKKQESATGNESQKDELKKHGQANIVKKINQPEALTKDQLRRRQPPTKKNRTTNWSQETNASSNDADPLKAATAAFGDAEATAQSTQATSEPKKPATATALNDNTPIAETKPTKPTKPTVTDEQVAPTEQPKPVKPVAQATPPPATMPALADLNSDQMALLDRAAADYKRATRQEFHALLARGRELGKANGATWGGLPHGGTTRNSGTKQRFYFLGWHHPHIATTAFTPQKKSFEPFNQEMRKAVWKAVRNTPAWKEASK